MSDRSIPFSERYREFTKIGQGGLGEVYKAIDTVLDKPVAIKLLNIDKTTDEQLVRFQLEAKASAKLNHQNLVTILDFGFNDENEPFLVMEFVDGISLSEKLEKTGKLSVDTAVPIFLKILEGLKHAHDQGIIHRDLKPANILFIEDENGLPIVKIVDFGIAKIIGSEQKITHTGAIIGSPPYMSPEQIEADEIDLRTDIYAFACLVFKCLTGQPPYVGNNIMQTLEMHLNDETPQLDITYGDDETVRQFNFLVRKSLEKDKSKRFDSVDELISILKLMESPAADEQADEDSSDEEVSLVALIDSFKTANTKFLIPVSIVAIFSSIGLANYFLQEREKDISISRKLPVALVKDSLFPSGKSLEVKLVNSNGIDIYTLKGATDEDLELLLNDRIEVKLGNGKKTKQIQPNKISAISILHCELVGIDGLKILSKLPLKILYTVNIGLNDEDMKRFPFFGALEELKLQSSKITGPGLIYLKRQTPKLESLFLSLSPVNDETFEYLTELKGLKKLMISTSNSVTGNTFKYLAKLPKLNYLIFDDLGSLEFNNVKELGKIKTLKNLQLADMYLKDPSQWSEVSKVASINSFSCLKTNISDEAIFKIIEKLKLTSLNISECPNLSDRAFETIANSQVANLAVNYNRISQSKIEILARSSRLKVLYLIGCDLTDDHISMLSKFKNIEYLNLAENNRISVSKREELKKLLSAKIVF